MVDYTLLLINCLWAFVVLASVAVGGLLLRRFSFKDALAEEVVELAGKAGDLRHRVNLVETFQKEDEDKLLKLTKDVSDIRAGLEKLKAIPPKTPRY